MTISSSLNASVAGLAANATRLAAISDNIANSSTFGYKRAVTDFHSMVIENGAGTYAAGGVRTTNMRLIDQRGSLVSTANATDLAVRGRGMLPVTSEASVSVDNGENPMFLTTTGSFRTDDLGYLRTSSGLILMGWPALPDGTIPTFPRDTSDGLEPIRINSNQFAGEATTFIELSVNLPATSTDSTSTGETEELSVEYFDNLGKSENLSIEFIPTVPGAGSSNQWTMVLRDSASGGAVVGEFALEFDDTRGAGGTLLSVTPISGGTYDAVTGQLSINVAGGPMDVGIGPLGSSTGLTQLSDAFQPVTISKNGTPVGNLTSVEVDANGFVRASFDIGINRVLYQIPLVDVPNVNGLEALDYQTYRATPDSGTFFLWDAGDGPTGDIVSFAREESATDVAGELTDLIQTQRAYSSNAKVIQTVDEMLQETTNIKR
ncbi:flagellar hook-basal body complex protein [Loktanella sp. IMCC34160]|uniref:flagellar hook protein FlgE n=1 Tax=Loktanella sp. IMCC34160 TaxID=2510646 RepID=UPI00101D6733|nr:flagellar hook-basal body complex protein [Loktanella sp. IMCC34160]RYG91451.1 flagellar hook-basal body complex protein [Loktanella sp. IMCC34160]